MEKKVVLIDPWGTANTSEYLNGLIYGLGSLVRLTVFTNYYFKMNTDTKAELHRIFFRKSENMSHGKIRTFVRGIEYILGYFLILKYLKKNKEVEIIHINWLLNYKLDIRFLHILKRHVPKIIYTAHNVIPHVHGENTINDLRAIYSLCNRVIVHGESVKKEFISYFPEFKEKLYVQKHGANIKPNIEYDESLISDDIKQIIVGYERKYIFFGRVFFNKGLDRILKIWDESFDDALLIIAGMSDENYPELNNYKQKIKQAKNILELNYFVDDNLLNYLISNSNLILLPYRHASMSGVVFTAADFSKTVLCTDVGALSEYLKNGEDSFVIFNDDEHIKEKMKMIHYECTNEQLAEMGEHLHKAIGDDCSWKNVVKKMVKECYV